MYLINYTPFFIKQERAHAVIPGQRLIHHPPKPHLKGFSFVQLWGKAWRQWLTFLQELRPVEAQPIREKHTLPIGRPFVETEEAAWRAHEMPLHVIAPQRFPNVANWASHRL